MKRRFRPLLCFIGILTILKSFFMVYASLVSFSDSAAFEGHSAYESDLPPAGKVDIATRRISELAVGKIRFITLVAILPLSVIMITLIIALYS